MRALWKEQPIMHQLIMSFASLEVLLGFHWLFCGSQEVDESSLKRAIYHALTHTEFLFIVGICQLIRCSKCQEIMMSTLRSHGKLQGSLQRCSLTSSVPMVVKRQWWGSVKEATYHVLDLTTCFSSSSKSHFTPFLLLFLCFAL